MNKQFYHLQYNESSTNIQLVMPLDFEVLIPGDDSVRLLSQIVEELDFRNLMLAYSSKGRNPAVPPRILFQVLVYAYMNGIYGSRQIEKACRRDINFMWLLEGHPAPDHNTLNRFRRNRLAPCLEGLFCQLVLKLHALGEVAFENLFVDGTKIEANANKYSFVWKGTVEKNEAKLREKIRKLLEEAGQHQEPHREQKGSPIEALEALATDLAREKEETGMEFVHGTGRRKSRLQKNLEKATEYLDKQKQYDGYNRLFEGRNSFSKTDTDATFMRMKDDHMKNSQLKPGYNVQAGVEGGYVVGIDISLERADQPTLIPFLDRLFEAFKRRFKNIITDAGYESEENYLYLEGNSQIPYIKPALYDQWKKRNFKNLIGKRENMTYDAENDLYLCNQGRRLTVTGTKTRKSQSGYEAKATIYECESCDDCSVKSRCTKAKGNRSMEVSKVFDEKRAVSWQNIMTPQGILLRINRSIQVEGFFGITKQDYGFRRFLTRGKGNVRTEYLLLAFAFNVNRLHQNIQGGTTGRPLYEKKVA